MDPLIALVERFRARSGAPGVAAALVPAAGPVNVVARGERVRGGGDPVTPDDRWHIGSCMKAMTAVTVARFAERGELDWSAPVASLFDGDIDTGWQRVTLADVLVHTAGTPANPTAEQMRAALTDPAPLTAQRARLAAGTLARPPSQPGRFRYSNLGYVLVGAALERLSGRPFEDVLAAEVLRPLGITSGGFGPPGDGQPRGHRARWSVAGLGAGRGPAIEPDSTSLKYPPDNPPLLSPAGRLHLSPGDWARFLRTFLDQPDRLIGPESTARICTRPAGVATEQGMGWWMPTRGPLLQRVAYLQQGSNTRWVATAAVSRDRTRAALVACNDGRTRLFGGTVRLALAVLGS